LAELIKKYFAIEVSARTMSRHLRKMGFTCQKPSYRAAEQDPEEVAHFLEDTFPRIQRLAAKWGLILGFKMSLTSIYRRRRGVPEERKVTPQKSSPLEKKEVAMYYLSSRRRGICTIH